MVSLVGIKKPVVLANYLRSRNPLTQEDRNYLADYIEGKIKGPVGRPKKPPMSLNFGKMSLAVTRAGFYLWAWRKKYGRKHKVTLQNGKTFNLREEACTRASIRHNKVDGPRWGNVTPDQIEGRLKRSKNKRF